MKEEIKSGEFIAVTADGSAGETLEGEAAAVGGQQQVQFIMAAEGEEGDHEGQTIGKNLKAKNSKYWKIISIVIQIRSIKIGFGKKKIQI